LLESGPMYGGDSRGNPVPIPLGEVIDYEPSVECDFRLIIIASTLNHNASLTEAKKREVVRTAVENAIAGTAAMALKL